MLLSAVTKLAIDVSLVPIVEDADNILLFAVCICVAKELEADKILLSTPEIEANMVDVA